MEIKEALQTALEFEKKGHSIYGDTAEKTSNPLLERTFNYLAEQELNHIDEIKGYIQRGNMELKGDRLKDTQEFFTMTVSEFKEKAELSDNDVKAHETALELEQSSYNFYKQQQENTSDGQLRKFFSFLMEQENAHYELIQKTYEYIKNPVGFYTEEEGWMADGG